jgi:hypothetical protein
MHIKKSITAALLAMIGTTNPQTSLHVNGDLLLYQGFEVSRFSRDSLMTDCQTATTMCL